MAFSHGKLTAVLFDHLNLSAFLNEISGTGEIDASETTTFGQNNKTYIPGLADGTVSISGLYDAATEGSDWSLREAQERYTANLLTANQASVETDTTGWVTGGTNCTASQSNTAAALGTYSLRLSSTASGDMATTTTAGTGGFPVTAGVGYTASVLAKAGASARSTRLDIVWYDSGGSVVSTTSGTAATSSTSVWTVYSNNAVAPATATTAAIKPYVVSTAAGSELHYFDAMVMVPGAPVVPTNPDEYLLNYYRDSGDARDNGILTYALAGLTDGNRAGMASTIETNFEIASKIADANEVKAEAQVTGGIDTGVLLEAAQSVSTATTTNGTSVNHGAATSNGGVAHLHITSNAAAGTTAVKVQHSTDDAVWADLVTFTTVAAGVRTSQRTVVATATTVNQYLRATSTTSSTGAVVYTVAFARR